MATKIEKTTAKLMKAKIERKLQILYAEQEAGKPKSIGQQFAKGGEVPQYQGGGYAGLFGAANDIYNSPLLPNSLPNVAGPDSTTLAPTNATNPYSGNLSWFDSLNLNKGLGYAGQLAPVAYNLVRGLQKPQHLNASDYYNPEYDTTKTLMQSTKDQVNSLMGDRRFDVNPTIQSNVAANNATNRNLSNIATSAGGLQSNQIATNAALNRSNATTYATANNANNQYLGQQVQMLGQLGMNQAGVMANLGGQQAATNLQVRDINDRNLAARNTFLGASTTGLSNFSQMQQLMNNKFESDKLRSSTFKDMFPNTYQFLNFIPGLTGKLNKGVNG